MGPPMVQIYSRRAHQRVFVLPCRWRSMKDGTRNSCAAMARSVEADFRMRILFIGNSYTSRNNLPGLLRGLGADAAPPIAIETEAIVAGGASLRRHWNAGAALQRLNASRWDYVVLQDQSTLPVKNA